MGEACQDVATLFHNQSPTARSHRASKEVRRTEMIGMLTYEGIDELQ
jgi:hypothetical protein